MARQVSLKEVASAAGVSVSTASRVLAGVDRNVSADMVESVMIAQERLGYKVNAAARALRVQTTGLIGLVVPAIDNPYFSELVAAFSRELDATGRRVVTIDTREDVETERRQLQGMDRVLVDAVVIAPVDRRKSAPAVAQLARTHRVVQVDRTADGVDAPYVVLDDAAGTRLLFEHLRTSGRERILLIDTPEQSSASYMRTSAFRELAGPTDGVLLTTTFTMRSGLETAAELLALHDRCDAIICTADVVAVGVLTALQEAGRRVPEDIALASFDGTFLTQITSPGLTSFESRVDELAQGALALADGVGARSKTIAPQLAIRTSTSS